MIALSATQSPRRNLAALRSQLALARVKPRRRLRRAPRIFFPVNAERSYYLALGRLAERMKAALEQNGIPALPQIVAEARADRPALDGVSPVLQADMDVRLDAWGTLITKLMDLLRGVFAGIVTDGEVSRLADRVGREISQANAKEIRKVFKAVVGVDVFTSEPWLEGELRAFVAQNVSLIKSVPERYLADVERIVFDGARRGLRHEEIAKQLREVPDVRSRKQAALIARDQTAKFNAALTERRQTQLGVKRYVWRTARDARVRDEHRVREGLVFSWDAPPFDGHPGQPINCRCISEPLLADVIGELGIGQAEGS